DDLHFAPAELYKKVSRFPSPMDFIAEDAATFAALQNGYNDDMASAKSAKPVREPGDTAVYILPNEKWARRVSGVYSNGLARSAPDRGHAVLTNKADGTFLVSVRAPLNNKTGADELCRSFPTGGGRKAAAGINALPEDMLDTFMDRFASFYAQ
ncbi:MAG: DHH family phosphoesterase, partial [Rhodobacterales bacterium]|nr:DHH family phosphoesterase [Rhodobacterales bacterium]